MSRRWGNRAALFLSAALLLPAGYTLNAGPRPQAPVAAGPATPAARASASVQDALIRPYDFPFKDPTPLGEVVQHLGRTLGVRVVLDRAGLDRVDVRPDDLVELDLDGVRLKTGLKLLLDQLDLTYRVEAEDNLLIITDLAGAADPFSEVLDEVKELHRDIHDLQDAVEEIRGALGLGEAGPMMRKPTIIEEIPGPAEAPIQPPPAQRRPGI